MFFGLFFPAEGTRVAICFPHSVQGGLANRGGSGSELVPAEVTLSARSSLVSSCLLEKRVYSRNDSLSFFFRSPFSTGRAACNGVSTSRLGRAHAAPAALSARSFPSIPQWAGIQLSLIGIFSWLSFLQIATPILLSWLAGPCCRVCSDDIESVKRLMLFPCSSLNCRQISTAASIAVISARYEEQNSQAAFCTILSSTLVWITAAAPPLPVASTTAPSVNTDATIERAFQKWLCSSFPGLL